MQKDIFRISANGAKIPVLGFGTWTLRGEQCASLVERAIALGYRNIDTAAMYGNEQEVGEGLRAAGIARPDVFVTTKVWWTDIAPGDLERSAEASLKRLGLDYVDLLLIHWPNPAIPLEGSIRALNAARRSGLARNIGVSNFTTSLLQQALALSEAPLVANQVEYHPYLRQTKILDMCRAAGMALIAYSPLSRGGDLFQEKAVQAAARNHGKSPAQIVLRWLIQQPGVAAIPRTTKPERLAENIAIFDFQLTDDEMAAITALTSANRRIANYGFSPDWDRP